MKSKIAIVSENKRNIGQHENEETSQRNVKNGETSNAIRRLTIKNHREINIVIDRKERDLRKNQEDNGRRHLVRRNGQKEVYLEEIETRRA
jgi:hypothetical protein